MTRKLWANEAVTQAAEALGRMGVRLGMETVIYGRFIARDHPGSESQLFHVEQSKFPSKKKAGRRLNHFP